METILVVDDESELLAIARDMLRRKSTGSWTRRLQKRR